MNFLNLENQTTAMTRSGINVSVLFHLLIQLSSQSFHCIIFSWIFKCWIFNIQHIQKPIYNNEFRLFRDSKTSSSVNLRWKETFWKSSWFALLCQEIGFVFANKMWHFLALYHFSVTQMNRFSLLTNFKIHLQVTSVWGETFSKDSRYVSLSQKISFVLFHKIWHLEPCKRYNLLGFSHTSK